MRQQVALLLGDDLHIFPKIAANPNVELISFNVQLWKNNCLREFGRLMEQNGDKLEENWREIAKKYLRLLYKLKKKY